MAFLRHQCLPLCSFFTVEGEEEQRKVTGVLASDNIGSFFFDTTCQLINSNSYALVGNKTLVVDLVRNVLKPLSLSWAATEIVSSA